MEKPELEKWSRMDITMIPKETLVDIRVVKMIVSGYRFAHLSSGSVDIEHEK